MLNGSIAQDTSPVKDGGLADHPILVCTLQQGYFLLDLNTDEPMRPLDYIPFQGEPVYTDNVGAWAEYGLEAR